MSKVKAEVYYDDKFAGYLTKDKEKYSFKYSEEYLNNENNPSISLTLPKSGKIFMSDHLFPFFFGLLSEGDNKDIQCRMLKIDENDHFTRLLKTAEKDTIGGITVKEVNESA